MITVFLLSTIHELYKSKKFMGTWQGRSMEKRTYCKLMPHEEKRQ